MFTSPTDKKTVIHTWVLRPCNRGQNHFWGFGDMLRGSASLYSICNKLGYNLIVDYSNHPVSKFLECIPHKYSTIINTNKDNIMFESCDNNQQLQKIIERRLENSDFTYFSTNGFLDSWNITDNCRTFMEKLLVPKKELAQYIEAKINKENPYNIMHFRLGDSYLLENNEANFEKYNKIIYDNLRPNSLLLSDSNKFKQYVKQNKTINVFETNSAHLGVSDDLNAVRDTLFEFFVATNAESIVTYSNYSHVSGFMTAVSKIYNIPLIGRRLN